VNVELLLQQARIVAVRIATLAWTVAQTALNLVLRANPIGIVITAIALLVAGIVIAYRNCATFREAIAALWNALKFLFNMSPIGVQLRVMTAAMQWAIAHGIGPLKSAFDSVWGVIQSIIGAIQSLIGWISRIKFPSLPKFLSKIPGSPFMLPPSASRFAYATSTGGARARPSSSSSGGGMTINVYGAIDPEGTARQIRRLLDAHDRRQGRTA
jgi:hypothetical protein